MARGKSVSEVDRQEWLNQYEHGKNPAQIAQLAKRPVRTVKENIQRAKRDRDHALVRAGLLKDATTEHYRDLFSVAERLRDRALSQAETEQSTLTELAAIIDLLTVDDLRTSLLIDALREHVPRSPLWTACGKWDGYNRQVLATSRQIRNDAKALVAKLTSDKKSLPINQAGFAESLWQAARAFARGDPSEREYVREEISGGHTLDWGATRLGGPSAEDRGFAEIEGLHRKKVTRFIAGDDGMVSAMGQAIGGRVAAGDAIVAEVERLVLRRILPGDCHLCP